MCIITLHTFHATIVSKGGTGWPLAFVRQYCDLQVRKEWLLVIAWRRRCHDNSCPPPWFVVPPLIPLLVFVWYLSQSSQYCLVQSEQRLILEALESFVFSMCFQLENFILQKEPVILSYEPLISVFFYDLSQSILSKLNYFFFVAKVIDVFV